MVTAQRDSLRAFFDAHGGREVWDYDVELAKVRHEIQVRRSELDTLRQQVRQEEERLYPLRFRVLEEEAGLAAFDHPAKDSIALGSELASIRRQVSALARSGTAVRSLLAAEEPLTPAARRRLAKDTARLVLRAFNAEVQNIITSATAANYETSVAKIHKAAEALTRLGRDSGTEISPEYVTLRLRELRLAVDHLRARKLEREIEREHRAELREYARVERELELERDRLRKERQHYRNVLGVVEAQGDEEDAARLQERLVTIEKAINDIDYRVANRRAGYVYVISNIGSFGSRMVKIGMTRRLDPMDRVKELGDASVPFRFDVHALFFAEDAVDVEARLHRHFADRRVNRINTRREFFYATPAEVRDALTKIAGNLLEFTEEPVADQYRQSLQIATGEVGG